MFVSKCQGDCYAMKATLCDLGDPGWGDPWFPHWGLVASRSLEWPIVILWFFRSLLLKGLRQHDT